MQTTTGPRVTVGLLVLQCMVLLAVSVPAPANACRFVGRVMVPQHVIVLRRRIRMLPTSNSFPSPCSLPSQLSLIMLERSGGQCPSERTCALDELAIECHSPALVSGCS